MNDLRTAAHQALEALEYHVEQTRPIQGTTDAITALRAALAQPVPKPVAWRCSCGANLYIDEDGAPRSKA